MNNPWTKKNPLLSIWLSAANTVVGSARSRATASAKRQAATAQAHAARSIVDFWTAGPATPRPKPKRRARR